MKTRPKFMRSLRRLAAVAMVPALLLAGVGAVLTAPPAAADSNNVRTGGLGYYPGDGAEPGQMQLFKSDLTRYGVPADTVVLMIDNSSETGFRGSTWGHFIQAGAWKDYGANRPQMVISVPLAISSGFDPSAATAAANLTAVINGSHDGAYQYLANALVSAGYPGAIIRLGWEFEGNWMPWQATQNPGLYIAAFRHVHDIFAAASSSFRYDWTGAAGVPFDGTQAYPGDAYVNIVGDDIYDMPGINVAGRLSARAGFAAAHGKQVSYAEWGLTNNPGDDPTFIQSMYDFMNSLPVSGGGSLAYQSYFLGNPGNDTSAPHSLDHYPRSQALYQSLFTGRGPLPGSAFSGFRSIGCCTSDTPSEVSWAAGRMDTFIRGTDGALYHRWSVNGAWSPGWENLGGQMVGQPTVVSSAPGRLDVFVRGTDNGLWQKAFNGSWGPWQRIAGAVLTSAPAATTWGHGRLDVFVRGTDNGLWHVWSTDDSWSAWEPLGGTLASAPSAAAWGVGRIDVVVQATDQSVYHTFYQGWWQGWDNLHGSVAGTPEITSWGGGRLDLFVTGAQDSHLYHMIFAGYWNGYTNLGGTLMSGPGASSWGGSHIDVVVRGMDNSVYQTTTT